MTLPAGYPVNLARLVDCLVPSRGDALDIGAFTGAFCHLLESLGFSAFGLDPSAEAVRFGRERGLRLHLGSFPDDVPEELLRRRFALISIMEAICYFRDLRESLEVVRSLLARDGRLLIKCHQGLSRFYERPGVSLFDRYGDYVQGIPTEASLRRCLESSGFRVVKVIGSESESTLPFRMGGHPAGLAGLLRSASGRILNKLHERFLSGPETADQVIVLAALP